MVAAVVVVFVVGGLEGRDFGGGEGRGEDEVACACAGCSVDDIVVWYATIQCNVVRYTLQCNAVRPVLSSRPSLTAAVFVDGLFPPRLRSADE
jgi:uncharacterized protein YcfJ